MPVSTVLQTDPTTLAAATSLPGNTLGKDDFMKLLVTQLQHQDPLNPMDDREFISQMAQLSSLEATNNLAKTIQTVSNSQQQMQALQMVGHNIQYTDSTGALKQGQVSAALLDPSGTSLMVGTTAVPLSSVQAVL